MAPEDRRSSLVTVTIPLLCQYGANVTTRQIAEAAGVAEGTIFRVFRDKEELVGAAVDAVLDPLPALAELDGIDHDLPLRERMVAVTSVFTRRLQRVFNLMIALRMSQPPAEVEQRRAMARPAEVRIASRIEQILAPDRDEFRYPVSHVVRLLWRVTFAGSHPMITEGKPMSPEQIADLLLHGVMRHDDSVPNDSVPNDWVSNDSVSNDSGGKE